MAGIHSVLLYIFDVNVSGSNMDIHIIAKGLHSEFNQHSILLTSVFDSLYILIA